MQYTELQQDFDNLRATQTYIVGKVVDEAQNYIEFLEHKNAAFESLLAYLNKLDESKLTETKTEILEGALKLLAEFE